MMPPALIPGDPVPDDECWFRVITNRRHVTQDKTVHANGLKSRAFSLAVGKPWQHELSGRIASLAGDTAAVVQQAEQRVEGAREAFRRKNGKVPSGIRFMGLAVAEARELRATGRPNRADVIYTPIDDDKAHSDWVTYGTSTDEDLDAAQNWLLRILRVITPGEIEQRLGSCGHLQVSTT